MQRSYLLEEQLRSIRNRQLRHLFRALAIRAPSIVTQEPTFLAGMHFELVRGDLESLDEELGGAVADEAVAFHLTETETTFARATFGWLTSEGCTWATRERLDVKDKGKRMEKGKRTEHERASYP